LPHPVCAILPAKVVPKMTYTVSGLMLNPTHSHTFCCVYDCAKECSHSVFSK